MLVQQRTDAFHLIPQNEHALVSGEMARMWRGVANQPDVPALPAVLAIALHDSAWIETDEVPPFDPARGLPHDFQSLPEDRKVALYGHGIDTLESIQPYAALLVSLHYDAFVHESEHPGFHQREVRRQQRLKAQLAPHIGDHQITRDIALLRLLDRLSLRLCLTPPNTVRDRWPSWVVAPAKWDEVELRTRWKDGDTLMFSPFPFAVPLQLTIPYARVPARKFSSEKDWKRASEDAPRHAWHVSVVPE
ncbi:MAG: DUF3891 family protein [Myxococcota bacterium]